MRRFLLVDDEINILQALQRTLRQKIRDEEFLMEMYTDPRTSVTARKRSRF